MNKKIETAKFSLCICPQRLSEEIIKIIDFWVDINRHEVIL